MDPNYLSKMFSKIMLEDIAPPGTLITDDNIHDLVHSYITDKGSLPEELHGIPIGEWDVSYVTDMSDLFSGLEHFNEPLNNWNVSKVTNMSNMFNGCHSFNQPLICDEEKDIWNVSKVRYMTSMFENCISFDQDLSSWDVWNVKNMKNMFSGCIHLTTKPNWVINRTTIKEGMFTNTQFERDESPVRKRKGGKSKRRNTAGRKRKGRKTIQKRKKM